MSRASTLNKKLLPSQEQDIPCCIILTTAYTAVCQNDPARYKSPGIFLLTSVLSASRKGIWQEVHTAPYLMRFLPMTPMVEEEVFLTLTPKMKKTEIGSNFYMVCISSTVQYSTEQYRVSTKCYQSFYRRHIGLILGNPLHG